MIVAELTSKARFVIDAQGNRQAILLDLPVWEEIVALLEEIEEMEVEDHQQILKAVAESRQAYQTDQVKRGTADDLIADLSA
jgi:hypothetical protein